MDRAYYAEYYFLERNHWWFVIRSKILDATINKTLTSKRNLSILNIGVATGATNYILENYGNVTSIEYDKECADFTYQDSGKPILVASIEELPFKNNTFDIVCAFDVIEHVENDRKSVFEMHRLCNPGGNIFITVPAYMILWSNHDEVNQHLRRYQLKDIILLFKNTEVDGYEIHKTYFNTILFPFILCFRLMSSLIPDQLIRSGAGSDFTIVNNESLINKILFQIFNFERLILKKLTFRFGTSILYAWGKKV